jgi:glucan biosynthesis protein C
MASEQAEQVKERKVMKQRRYDIDWLRVLATLAIFFFHCAKFFDTFDWHLKNPQKSSFLTYFVILLAMWSMPLFFVLSGFGTWYALKSRNIGQYLFDRFKRLLIPLYTVGAFLLLPPQFYIDRFGAGEWYSDALLKRIPPYWDSWGSFRLRLDEPYLTNIWPGHLWFLQFLFTISLVTLPLLLVFKSKAGQRLIQRLAGWCERWGGIFLLLIPLLVVRIGLRTRFAGEQTWADFWEYGVFFVIGFVIAADKRFTGGIKRHGWMCLALGTLGFAGVIYAFRELGYNPTYGEFFSRRYVGFHVIWSVGSFSWIFFFLSLGAKYLDVNHSVLAYSKGAQLPFYILHQTIILLVGFYVIPLKWSIPVKYLVISTAAFVLIIALYELLIKPFNPIRFLFGMRPKRKQPVVPAVHPEEAAA